MTKFKPLDIPPQWRDYWTAYPHGYTIFEALCSWLTTVNEGVDIINEWEEKQAEFIGSFDTNLQGTVRSVLQQWKDDGILEIILSEGLESRLDTVEDELPIITNQVTDLGESLNLVNEKLNNVRYKTVNAEDYPRLAGETDDTGRIERAYADLEPGDTLIIRGDYYITNLIFDKSDIHLDCRGWLIQLAGAEGTALTIGKLEPTFNVTGIVRVKREIRNWSIGSTGLKLLNLNGGHLTVDIIDFTNNLVMEGNDNGCAYNKITILRLGNGKKNLQLVGTGTGWVNENTFFGGRFYWNSSIVDYARHHIYIPLRTMNNNSFYSPCLEAVGGGTLIYCNGRYTHFYNPRLEHNNGDFKTIHFGPDSIYNQMIYPYLPTTVSADETIEDEGSRNHIYGRDMLDLGLSLIRSGGLLVRGNPNANPEFPLQNALVELYSTSSGTDNVLAVQNANRETTFNVDGVGRTTVTELILASGKKIENNGVLTGPFKASDSYITKGFTPWSISGTIPTSATPPAGTAVFCTANNRIYVKLNSGWGYIQLTT